MTIKRGQSTKLYNWFTKENRDCNVYYYRVVGRFDKPADIPNLKLSIFDYNYIEVVFGDLRYMICQTTLEPQGFTLSKIARGVEEIIADFTTVQYAYDYIFGDVPLDSITKLNKVGLAVKPKPKTPTPVCNLKVSFSEVEEKSFIANLFVELSRQYKEVSLKSVEGNIEFVVKGYGE